MRALLAVLICCLGCSCEQKDAGETGGYRFPGGDPAEGKKAFVALNCIQCHEVNGVDLPRPNTEQPLDLTLGKELRFVKSYQDIITAITNPQHVVNKQYAGILEDMDPEGHITAYMPDLRAQMSVLQLTDLTAFLDRVYAKLPEGYRTN